MKTYGRKNINPKTKKCPPDAEVYISREDLKYSWVCTTVDIIDINIEGCITLSNVKEDNIEPYEKKILLISTYQKQI